MAIVDITTSESLLGQFHNPENREQAWQTFFERYRPLIEEWCKQKGLRHDEVDELTQRVLVKLIEEMTRFVYDPAGRFRAWLRKVVNNEVFTYWRKKATTPVVVDHLSDHELASVAAPTDAEDLVQVLDDALVKEQEQAQDIVARVRQRVAKHTWQAYWQTVIEDQPAADVARKLGISTASVYMAKKRVGVLLREEGAALQDQPLDP
jgi:RNA polymerase sigma-70 factor (ECF subfamily)